MSAPEQQGRTPASPLWVSGLNRRHWPAIVALAVPAAGFALLVARPQLDVAWEHHPAHFWLVLLSGVLTAVLAYATGEAARRRHDPRVFLVSLAFLSAAGFLGLHALATPGVLLAGTNPGFALATPVGLAVASVFAAVSSLELSRDQARWLMDRARMIRALLLAVMVLWAVFSVAEIPPLDGPTQPERASGPLVATAALGFVLYAFAVVRYVRLTRHPASPLPLAMAAAFALLAEAEVAVAWGRNWHLSWWQWHVLMLAAFLIIAVTAHRSWHEERFSGLYSETTARGQHEISVLFADLQGFTSFSERHEAQEVQEMLNEYFSRAIPPIVERHGGEIDRLIGDAVMVTFNTYDNQPDHAARAARAALALQEATSAIADQHPGWPRFRVGVNTGPAVAGVVDTTGGRTFTAIGDTVNLAARLEANAPVGGVALGAETVRRLPGAQVESLGVLPVKGKAEPVEAYRLLALAPEGTDRQPRGD